MKRIMIFKKSQSPFSSGEVFHPGNFRHNSNLRHTGSRLNPLLVAGKYSTLYGKIMCCLMLFKPFCLNPLLVAGKYSTCPHALRTEAEWPAPCLNPLLVAGKYSTVSGPTFGGFQGWNCLNPLLVAGKYSTIINCVLYALSYNVLPVSIPF